ncbi:MAG TPA: glycine cleavage system protein GcvH [Anaerolineales bacterium]|nr:glycine cleavage system protein GcvH [Anaerolineales bacterium]
MSNIPSNLLYTTTDEWVLVEGDQATIGVTDYAQDALSDIVFVELPSVGDNFSKEETFGTVESVKAASDLHMPISGAVIAVNESLPDAPDTVNRDPYGAAWMLKVKMSDPAELSGLMNATAYEAYCASR